MALAGTAGAASTPALQVEGLGVRYGALREYAEDCVARNASSYDAQLIRWCNTVSKHSPMVVPLRVLRRTLDDAVDAIGAYSLLNPEWKALADAAGLPPPTELALVGRDPDLEATPALQAAMALGYEMGRNYTAAAAAAAEVAAVKAANAAKAAAKAAAYAAAEPARAGAGTGSSGAAAR